MDLFDRLLPDHIALLLGGLMLLLPVTAQENVITGVVIKNVAAGDNQGSVTASLVVRPESGLATAPGDTIVITLDKQTRYSATKGDPPEAENIAVGSRIRVTPAGPALMSDPLRFQASSVHVLN